MAVLVAPPWSFQPVLPLSPTAPPADRQPAGRHAAAAAHGEGTTRALHPLLLVCHIALPSASCALHLTCIVDQPAEEGPASGISAPEPTGGLSSQRLNRFSHAACLGTAKCIHPLLHRVLARLRSSLHHWPRCCQAPQNSTSDANDCAAGNRLSPCHSFTPTGKPLVARPVLAQRPGSAANRTSRSEAPYTAASLLICCTKQAVAPPPTSGLLTTLSSLDG